MVVVVIIIVIILGTIVDVETLSQIAVVETIADHL